MADLLTAAQMRAIEQAAIGSGAVTGLELMERAGAGVVEAVIGEWPDLAQGSWRAVILCGPGNNGGDGFVVARLLTERGWEMEVHLLGDPAKLPPDARTNYDRWSALGATLPLAGSFEPSSRAPALVVDALFGTGLTRPVEGLGPLLLDLADMRGITADMAKTDRPVHRPRIVAVDLPSGLCSDSGRMLFPSGHPAPPDEPDAFVAACDLTVAFHALKPGHVLADGPDRCGKSVVVDIGLRRSDRTGVAVARMNAPPDPRQLGKTSGHKYGHGHALVLAGGAGRTGAARLAARGALRIGAGLVTLGAPQASYAEVAAHSTAVMLTQVDGAGALAERLKDARISALCLGPGLGVDRARDLVPVALGKSGSEPNAEVRSIVLDADALTAFGTDPERLFAMLHDNCVLTPHGGEFARLFPDIAAKLDGPARDGPAFSKIDATRAAAARAGCVVLFKGPDTVIAAPDGRCVVNSAAYARAAPWLATAGAGDVLAGFIAGLLARGLGPMQAAGAAAWLHVECARSFGPGLIAEDLPEEVPKVFRALGLQAAASASSAAGASAISTPSA